MSAVVRAFVALWLALIACDIGATTLSEVRIVDVTPNAFVVVYRDVQAVDVTLALYRDVLGTVPVTGHTVANPFLVAGDAAIATTLGQSGLARLRVSALDADTPYFFRLQVTPAAGGPPVPLPATGVLPGVRTMQRAQPVDNAIVGANVEFPGSVPADAAVLLVAAAGGRHPVSHVVGDGYSNGFVAVALSNVFDAAGAQNLPLGGGTALDLDATAGIGGQASAATTLAAGVNIGVVWVADVSPLVLGAFVDSDGDGMPDDYEIANGLNPGVDDAAGDLDADGLTNLVEYTIGTDPRVGDSDGDGISDGDEVNIYGTSATSSDSDQDGLSDFDEIQNINSNPLNADSDGDGASDAVEVALGTDPNDDTSVPFFDEDGDGVADEVDNCPLRVNPDQIDTDSDGDGNECDDDDDDDGVVDEFDNAPLAANPGQEDVDLDGVGDAADNCLMVPNADQANHDTDANGDVCDSDDDDDGIEDFGVADAPSVFAHTITSVIDITETSIVYQPDSNTELAIYKFDWENENAILLGRLNLASRAWTPETPGPGEAGIVGMLAYAQSNCGCAVFPSDSRVRIVTDEGELWVALPASTDLPTGSLQLVADDGSSYQSRVLNADPPRLANLVVPGPLPPALDNCRIVPNPDQTDTDADGIGDACDITADDLDGDGVANANDNCPTTHNEDQSDIDADGSGDLCDNDADGDGIDNEVETSVLRTNPLSNDSNGDGVSDADEDFDYDGIGNADELARGLSPDSPDTDLVAGLNLIHFPVILPADFSAFDLLAVLGGDGVVERIERVDPQSEQIAAASYAAGVPAGVDFDISADEAYMVTMLQARTHSWGAAPLCRAIDFVAGKHLVGLGCVPKGMSAHDLLTELGATNISAIQSLDTYRGRWRTAGTDAAANVGENYALTGTDGYIAHLNNSVTSNAFALEPPGLSFDQLSDGQTVFDPLLPISGFVSDPNAQVSINGQFLAVVDGLGGARFAGFLDLVEGANTLTVLVRGTNNQLIEQTFTITFLTPPDLEIISHSDGEQTPSVLTTIVGTVSDDLAAITVNDIPVAVNAGEFVLPGFALSDGNNVVTARAVGANGGVAVQTITIESLPISMVLTTPEATVPFSNTHQQVGNFQLFFTPAQFAQATLRSTPTPVDSVSYLSLAGSHPWQKILPNIVQNDYILFVSSNSALIGETDVVYLYSYLDDQLQVVRDEHIKFRVGIVGVDNVAIGFDEQYDNTTVTTSMLTISGRIIGTADSVTFNGQDAVFSQSGSMGLGNFPFTIDLELGPGANYFDVVAANAIGSATREILIFLAQNELLEVNISSHASKAVVSGSDLTVTGTVSNASANVTVNGVTATVTANPDQSGDFSAVIPLTPGANTVRASATLGSLTGGDAIRVTQGAFDLTIPTLRDRALYHDNRPMVEGFASVDLQELLVNGRAQDVTGNTFTNDFNIDNLVEGESNELVIEATALTGETVTTVYYVFFEPYRFSLPNPTRTQLTFQIEVPENLIPDIVDWRFWALWDNTPPGISGSPTYGNFLALPGVTQLDDHRLEVALDVELHGDTFNSSISGQNMDFLDADGNLVFSRRIDTEWDFTASADPHVFITSLSEGLEVDHSPFEVFGTLRNITATSMTVNGETTTVGDDWTQNVDLVEGDNEILVEVIDDNSVLHTASTNITLLPPKRLDFTEGVGFAQPIMRMHQLSPPSNSYNIIQVGRPDWLNYTIPTSAPTSENNSYFRRAGLLEYYLVSLRPTLTAGFATAQEDYGIWLYELDVRGNFPSRRFTYPFWCNLIDPTYDLGPQINVLSHTDGETINTDTVDFVVEVSNDPFAAIAINGVAIEPVYTPRPFGGTDTRVDVTYTATLPLNVGANAITIVATSENALTSMVSWTINRSP